MSDILTDVTDGVMTITFNRPDKKNSITAAMYAAMADALAQAKEQDAVRVVVFQGNETIFSAGNDIADFLEKPPSGQDAPVYRFLHGIAAFPKPIVAAVCGPAVGIGTTMLMHCDLVYAGDNAAFSLPFVNLGLCPEAASSLLVPQMLGYHRAAEALLLGEPFMAEAAQEVAPTFLGKTKLVDFSADFRLGDAQTYARYYHTEHQHPELLNGQFVYGLPEIYRDEIRKAEAVANPGCFALLVQLLLFPLKGKMSGADVIAISGTSGGGRAPRDPIDHPALSGNIRSYLINEHRHTPEILATSGLKETALNFTPTVGPFLRGIFANGFIQTEAAPDLSVFDGHPFVRLVDKVEMTNVVSTNFIDLSYSEGNRGTIIAQGALDNLLRGASGTAVQNMNLMFGFDETSGLDFDSPVYP